MNSSSFAAPTPPGTTLRVLRRYHDLKQSEFGRIIGLSHSQVSRLESGQQTMRSTEWRAIVPRVALGDPAVDERNPVHIVARFTESRLLFGLIRGAGAMFADGDLALRAAALLDALYPEPVFPLPVWVSWLDRDWDTPFEALLLDDNSEASRPAIDRAEGRLVPAARHIADMVQDVLRADQNASSRALAEPVADRP